MRVDAGKDFPPMYCPQCGQQQVSGDFRFCSRCGFPLGGVMELLSRGGVLPAGAVAGTPKQLSPRQKGIRQGAMLMLSTLLAVPLMAIISVFILRRPEIFVPLTAILCFMGGLLRILYAAILEEGSPQVVDQSLAPPSASYSYPAINAGWNAPALPPQRSQPVTSARPRVDTSELVAPPSVTENTTRLLDDDAKPRMR